MECAMLPQQRVEVLLKDGQVVLLRPIDPADMKAWLAFIDRCSLQAKHQRFHHAVRQLKLEDAIRFCTVDYSRDFAIVAETISHECRKIVAIGRYYRLPDDTSAEIAILVEDAYQGKGLGTYLLRCLADMALWSGITCFEADVLVENRQMFALFETDVCHINRMTDDGVYHVCYPIACSGDTQDGKSGIMR